MAICISMDKAEDEGIDYDQSHSQMVNIFVSVGHIFSIATLQFIHYSHTTPINNGE